MTIERVIQLAEKYRPNTMFDDSDHMNALNRVETEVADFMRLHGDWEETDGRRELVPIEVDFDGYSEGTDRDTALLLPENYCDVYVFYVTAMMDYHNGEFDRYNSSMANAMSRMAEWKAEYRRGHTPLPRSERREHLI